ncbi:MAG TPA: hypothetical protein VEC60_11560, partial [Reyranella sp.]|nr:hypothetical protein [Reyranella sp.]
MAELQRFILKVLTGPNAGAEALLGERTTIGSAETDDITIGDGALGPGHFAIDVKDGAINVVVGDAPLALKDEFKGKGSHPVKPFELIKFGATCCAVGPEGAEWPSFAPTDLLPPAQPKAEEPPAPEAPAEEPPATDEPAEASAPEAKPAAADPRRKRIAVWAVAAAALVLVL